MFYGANIALFMISNETYNNSLGPERRLSQFTICKIIRNESNDPKGQENIICMCETRIKTLRSFKSKENIHEKGR